VSARRCFALARFAFRANARSAMARGGVAAFLLIALLGPFISLRNGQGWVLDEDMLFLGFIVGALFALRSGLEQQRESGLQTFLRHNLATPLEHAAGGVLALLATWLLLAVLMFVVALVCSAGDPGTAAWQAWVWGLWLGVLLPFLLFTETFSTLRIPLVLPLIAYFALIITLVFTLGEPRALLLLGTRADPAHPLTSLNLAGRAATVLVLGLAGYLAAVHARARVRSRE
jgi:hypothetical protein